MKRIMQLQISLQNSTQYRMYSQIEPRSQTALTRVGSEEEARKAPRAGKLRSLTKQSDMRCNAVYERFHHTLIRELLSTRVVLLTKRIQTN